MAEKNIGRVVPNYKGDYDASVQYAKLDVVYHDDSKSSYVALADTRGENPYTTPSKWGVVARAKYQVGQQDLEAAVQAVINKNGVHIKGANAALGFSQDPNVADTSTIKEVAPGTLSVSGNLNVLGNLNGNANSARALDHDIAINGQNIKTASGAANTLLADPQVTPINAGADLGVAATYPKVNARYSITGKYTNSPDDSVTWGHTLDVSSSLNGNLSLTINGPGDRYVASIISGTFSGWSKVVSGDISVGGRNYLLNSSGLSLTDSNRPVLNGAISNVVALITYSADGVKISNNQGTKEFFYEFARAWTDITKTPLVAGNTYTLSVKARGTAPQIALRVGYQNMNPAESVGYTQLDSTKWTKATFTFTIPVAATNIFMRINGGINNHYSGFTGNETIEFKEVMLEQSNVASDWTPAPEDTVATANALTTKVATFKDFNDVAKNMNAYSGNWQVQGAMQIANSPYGIAPRSTYVSVQTAGWNDAGSITYYDFTTKDFFVGTVSSGNLTWTKMANDATVVHTTSNETIAGDKTFTGNTTLANVNTSSIKTGTVTANGLRMDFREFAAGVEVWFTGTFTGDASYSWHDLGQMPSNITKPFSFVTAVMGGRSGIGGVSTQTDVLLMVHINSTGKIQYQLRHGVEGNTTDYKGIVLYAEGSASYFK